MEIKRESYLEQLISKKENRMVKIITGVRRSGKSYLLFNIYHKYLVSTGVKENQIIELNLEDTTNIQYRNPIILSDYIKELTKDKNTKYYVFLDEIQKVRTIPNPYLDEDAEKIGFVDTLNGLMRQPNLDVYVTGSNSKMLSTDVITEFRGRGDEIRVMPLTFKEYYECSGLDEKTALQQYLIYGGLPQIVTKKNHKEKSKYLKDLFNRTYITDVLERHKLVNNVSLIDDLLNIISSSIGSLTNPRKLSNTFSTMNKTKISPETINTYLDYLIDAFIINKAHRYDVKGKKYIDTPLKYYFVDIGLRNARIDFRQSDEENHIMENVIYNELLFRGFDVDVGVVEHNYKDEQGKSKRDYLEIDFVANQASKRYYIQSTLYIGTREKRIQETRSLNKVKDSFKKVVIVRDNIIPWHDEQGILYLGIQQFLLDDTAIDY